MLNRFRNRLSYNKYLSLVYLEELQEAYLAEQCDCEEVSVKSDIPKTAIYLSSKYGVILTGEVLKMNSCQEMCHE